MNVMEAKMVVGVVMKEKKKNMEGKGQRRQ